MFFQSRYAVFLENGKQILVHDDVYETVNGNNSFTKQYRRIIIEVQDIVARSTFWLRATFYSYITFYLTMACT